MQHLHPKHWRAAKGFANGIAAEGRQVFVAGQVGWNGEQQFASDDFVVQVEQALRNIVEVLAEAEARPEHIVRLTWYVIDKREYMSRLERGRPGLSPRPRPALPRHDAGAGGGAGGGPRQGRDRGHRRRRRRRVCLMAAAQASCLVRLGCRSRGAYSSTRCRLASVNARPSHATAAKASATDVGGYEVTRGK